MNSRKQPGRKKRWRKKKARKQETKKENRKQRNKERMKEQYMHIVYFENTKIVTNLAYITNTQNYVTAKSISTQMEFLNLITLH